MAGTVGGKHRLTTADVARIRGWNRVRAWRWMLRQQKKYGTDVVRDDEPRGYTIGREDFERIVARERSSFSVRIDKVEETLREHDQRLDGLTRDVLALRRAG